MRLSCLPRQMVLAPDWNESYGQHGGFVTMMRITHVITGLGSGGAETMLYKLLLAMDRTRFESSVVSLTTVGRIGQKMREIGVEVQSLGMHLRAGDPFGLLLLARRLRVKQPDLVQTWMYHANLVGGLAAKMAGGIPVVWNIRAGGDNFDGYRMDTMVAISLSALASHVLPARIIVNSETSKSNHRDLGYSRTHMTVIPNGFDTRAFRPNSDSRLGVRTELGLGPKAFLIGLIARFHPQKGHDNFLQAASILLSRFDNVHFLLCGLGVTPENDGLIKLIEKTGHRRNFHLLGETDDVPRVTAAID